MRVTFHQTSGSKLHPPNLWGGRTFSRNQMSTTLGNEKSARIFSDRSFFVDVHAACPCRNALRYPSCTGGVRTSSAHAWARGIAPNVAMLSQNPMAHNSQKGRKGAGVNGAGVANCRIFLVLLCLPLLCGLFSLFPCLG